MKRLLTILTATLILLLLITQIDDDLSKESIDLIERTHGKNTSESYLYLHGIFASEEEDPISVGSQLLSEYRKLDTDDTYEIIEYPDSKKIASPTGKDFCQVWEDDCLKHLFSSQLNIENLLSEHHVLVSRVDRFFEFNEYTTLSKPTIHELFPPYQYIAAANRIKTLEAIAAYRGGDAQKALDSLSLQFSKLRRSMKLQDNLIGKLVFLMKLSEIVDVMSIILSNCDTKARLIPSLSQTEKSFYMIAAREFGMSYYIFKNLDKNPEFFSLDGKFPGWLTRIVYKPNMTINSITPIYSDLERLTQLSPADFAKQIEFANNTPLSTSKLRNYIGSALVSISPEYTEYAGKFHDFEAKLALYNQLHHLKLEIGNMTNPYYENEAPKNSNGSLCFSGPLEDKRSLRCLKVKL
ncbi:hypothetical protein ACJJIF_13625 [Microbulbifer sp. SSSA002]|uniref:hypothetical protein n=1 Tax=Microbulbifer sp. SSSA002 TaxID=3243376 RepID=UPI0040397F71